MENTDKQVAEPLLQKFTILSIKGLGHYRCNIKKLQAYLNGNHVTVSPNILPADQDSWTGKTNQTIFTRQSKPMSTKFFSAVPQLSGNEQIYRHSSCAPQTVRQRKDISPLNILEYRSCCTKRVCGECGLMVFEVDFAFICNVCGQLIHKGCTDLCKHSHECVLCGGDPNRIYPFCHINNLSQLINGEDNGKKIFKAPTKTHAEKCFPIITRVHCLVATEERHATGKRFEKGQGQDCKRKSEEILPQLSKRRKIETEKRLARRNTRNKRCTNSKNGIQTVFRDKLNATGKTIKDRISLFVSKTINYLGYSFEMIKYRQRMYHVNDELTAQKLPPETRVTTGGKGEGTTMYFENDTDYIFVVKQVMCTDFPVVFMGIKNLTLFKSRRELTPPGYTRLELLQFSGQYRRKEIKASQIQSQSGSVYLSSEAFVIALQISTEKTCNLGGLIKGARSGPSTPMSDKYNSYDDVVALPCCCPDLLSKWLSRPRPQSWPQQEVLHAISLLDAHVVPVGFKGSPEQSLEWRVCFSLAELHLMQILNECQIQTYILLKKIAKSCLHPISKDITSYVVKNIILWICEKTPNMSFEKKHLLHRLLDSIEFLRQCIRKNYLPSYMISERNLIAGRLDRLQRRQLDRILNDLKNEQGLLFLRIGKLRDALLVMYKCPNQFREYGEKRDILERTLLMRNWIRESAWKPNMKKVERNKLAAKHKGYKILEREIDDILHVNEKQLKAKGWVFTEINDLWMQRLYQLLS